MVQATTENPPEARLPRALSNATSARPASLKVLHLEDNRMDAEIIHHFLESEFPDARVTLVSSRFAFVGELRLRPFDLIVSDFSMETFNGLEALDLARERAPEVPFLFYSGTIGEERASEAIARGARDCVPKGQIKRLGVAIRRAMDEVEERRKRHRAEERNVELERALNDAGVAQQRLEEKTENIQRLENVGALTADVAHDLNNLLAPLLMALPMLRDATPTPEGRKILDTLEKSARRGASLVSQILAVINGASEDPSPVSLEGPINGVVGFMGVCFPKNIVVEKNIVADLWRAKAVPAQISQLLLNLCFNARNSMPGGGTLSIGAENCSLDAETARTIPGALAGSFVLLRIEDTGSGIVSPAMRKLTDNTHDKRGEKSLGMPTVRNIVKRHGGFIQIQTAVALGSSIRVFLPAAV